MWLLAALQREGIGLGAPKDVNQCPLRQPVMFSPAVSSSGRVQLREQLGVGAEGGVLSQRWVARLGDRLRARPRSAPSAGQPYEGRGGSHPPLVRAHGGVLAVGKRAFGPRILIRVSGKQVRRPTVDGRNIVSPEES